MKNRLSERTRSISIPKIIGFAVFYYFLIGFMIIPCWDTLTSIFTTKNAAGEIDPFAVIRFFFAGNMSQFVLNSIKLAITLIFTVNIVGVTVVLMTEYFDIKGANILRVGYMTSLIFGGVSLATGYLFLYGQTGIITETIGEVIDGFNMKWFRGFPAVVFTMTFALTGNHTLFLRNAIRGIDYNTVEAARNMGAGPFKTVFTVVLPTLVPTLISLTVQIMISGLCAMSAPTLLGYDTIGPEIVRLAGSNSVTESFPHARAALLSVMLATLTITLLTALNSYERKGHYLSIAKTKAKLVKQKIENPVLNVLMHILAYVLFLIYTVPVALIVMFSFQTHKAIGAGRIDFGNWTFINYFGSESHEFVTMTGKVMTRENAITGLFSNEKTLSSMRLSATWSLIATIIAVVIVVIACEYIFKNRKKKSSTILEYSMLFPWLLPIILICYSIRHYFNSDTVWYVGNINLYFKNNVHILLIATYTLTKLPFALRMIRAAFYSIDTELEDAAKNLGSSHLRTFLRVKLPIIMPSVLAVSALSFSGGISDYDISAAFASPYAVSFGMVLKSMTQGEGEGGLNINATGRQMAATVFLMVFSGIILYLIYGVGGRDIAEKVAAKKKRQQFFAKLTGKFKKECV